MKKYYYLLLGIMLSFAALSCSGDDNLPPKVTTKFWFQLQEIDTTYSDEYTFSDFNIDIYENKENWLSETGQIFSGKFDSTGEMIIENDKIEDGKTYFVDIYTDDDFLSNWGLDSFRRRTTNSFADQVFLTPGKRAMGEWEFLSREFISDDERERFPVSLTVYKDFNVEIIDSTANGTLLEKKVRVRDILGASQFWISDGTFRTSDYAFYFDYQEQPFESISLRTSGFVTYIKD